jgi:hypothetical protein
VRDELGVRPQRRPVPIGELVHGDGPAEVGLEPGAERGEEVGFRHPPALELGEQRHPALVARRRHRRAERVGREAEVGLDRGEGRPQRRGEHAAEVRHDGGERRGGHAARRRTS